MVKYKSKSKPQLLEMISKKSDELTLQNKHEQPELIIEECSVEPEEIPIAENMNDSLFIELSHIG